jgi:hypothetical protein
MARKARAPWKRPNPRKRAGKASTHLPPAKKAAAKARARGAGRRYPNLVDNMRAASASKSPRKKSAKKAAKKASKKRVGRKRAAHKSAARKNVRKRSSTSREKDPHGGLTAAGRRAFAKEGGARLRPGVTKKASR